MRSPISFQHFVLALAACCGLGIQQASAEIQWQTQLKAAHAQAQSEGKLLLLHFYDDNCVWCERLEKGAFQSPEVQAAIEKNYVPVKVHAGKSPSIATTFKVTRFPTDVIVTTQGQALSHTVSPQAPNAYVAMLSQPLAAGQLASASSPAAQPQLAAGPTMNPLAQPASTPNANPPVTPVSSRTNNSLQSPQPSVKSPNVELALDGYCAVTVVEKDRWIEGDPKLGVIHLGQLYLFSSQEAMDKFLKNPEPYTPVLNGIDVVRFFEERKIVQGNREWGLKDPDHNRMFFFADEAAMNHFYEQHARYTDAALAVMAKAVKDANP